MHDASKDCTVRHIRQHLVSAIALMETLEPGSAFAARCQEAIDDLDRSFSPSLGRLPGNDG